MSRKWLRKMGVARFVVALLLAAALAPLAACARSQTIKTGLLIMAHGAPSKRWNQVVLQVESQVRERIKRHQAVTGVKLAFMEFTSPTIAESIRQFEEEDFDRIIAVPLLIAPSGHSEGDIPVLLGQYYDPDVVKTLMEEGAELARTRLHIIRTPTMSCGEAPEKVMLKRVKELSADPANEAVVILAHGDRPYQFHWDELMGRIKKRIKDQAGINVVEHAYVGMGHAFRRDALPAISRAASRRKRVLVVGLYVGMGARQLLMFGGNAAQGFPGEIEAKLSNKGLVPDESVAEWIAAVALQAAEKGD